MVLLEEFLGAEGGVAGEQGLLVIDLEERDQAHGVVRRGAVFFSAITNGHVAGDHTDTPVFSADHTQQLLFDLRRGGLFEIAVLFPGLVEVVLVVGVVDGDFVDLAGLEILRVHVQVERGALVVAERRLVTISIAEVDLLDIAVADRWPGQHLARGGQRHVVGVFNLPEEIDNLIMVVGVGVGEDERGDLVSLAGGPGAELYLCLGDVALVAPRVGDAATVHHHDAPVRALHHTAVTLAHGHEDKNKFRTHVRASLSGTHKCQSGTCSSIWR